MTDTAAEDIVAAASPEPLVLKPQANFNGQEDDDGDNKFQRAIAAWRSDFPIEPLKCGRLN